MEENDCTRPENRIADALGAIAGEITLMADQEETKLLEILLKIEELDQKIDQIAAALRH